MKKLVFLLFILSAFVSAQKKTITLDEIWGTTFRAERMQSFNALNGNFYAVLNYDRQTKSTSIDKYDFATLEKVSTIFSNTSRTEISSIEDYQFNNDESKLLITTESNPVFRHSTLGKFVVYDLKTKSIVEVDTDFIQEPTFSPDSKKIAFVKNNNIFIKNLESQKTTQVTFDGKKNEIINGVADWVYEEEFSFVRAFEWNSESNQLAFIRFDERQVPEFSMDIYGKQLYPTQNVFKYPKAGEKNAVVSLHIYNLTSTFISDISLENYEYIPRIKWSKDSNILSVMTLNRHQNDLRLYFVDSQKSTSNLILQETDKAYVDIHDNLTFLADNSFIWTSEKDGFNHIYHYDKTGKLKNQITKGNWEVTNFYGIDEKNKTIYYQSVEDGSINRSIYSISINGKNKKRLNTSIGNNSASFSKNFQYFINTFSDVNTPTYYTLHKNSGEKIKDIITNQNLKNKVAEYNFSAKEFFNLQTKDGNFNAWIIKPTAFDASKKYPVFIYQYSGPGSQSVSNSWLTTNDLWYQMLAQQGYIVVCVDGRGTGFLGAAFKKMTYKELGKYEVIDQIEAAKELGKLPYIDATRIGIWGWSYGGFMSANALFKGNDVFKMAIAVAPVTNWRNYDSVYTERFMQTPQENPSGYDENSPINHVEKLKGKFLLIHGSADDNVHVQNSMQMIEALVQANKQFEWAIYPDKNHGIYGGKTRHHLYQKMTDFIKNNL
ncbi:MAG TPA: S9 family peptidase [Flavobacteriaceae bacterium]|nr:S9 family peptidase [Flavobacteriaceae bacterium]HEX5743663.1 S9 family peptidase [Flavobacteriaceae bacterium]